MYTEGWLHICTSGFLRPRFWSSLLWHSCSLSLIVASLLTHKNSFSADSTDRTGWRSQTSKQVDRQRDSFLRPAISGMRVSITLGCYIAIVSHFRVLISQRGKQWKNTVKYYRKGLLKWPVNSVYGLILRNGSYAVIFEDSQKISASQNSGLIYINKSRKCFIRGFFIISLTNARKNWQTEASPDLQLLFLWLSCS